MKKTSFRILFSILLFSALTCAFLAAEVFAAGIKEVQFTGAEFESEYNLGYEIALPDVTAVCEGHEYRAEKAIVLPDGTTKVVAKQVLSVSGRYTVLYFAVIDGFRYETKYYFDVKDNLFDLERQTGSAAYDAEQDLIVLHLDGNNAFRYNSVVDLSDNDLSMPFLEMYNVSSQDGDRDFERIMITLTDADNENNYLNIRINAAPDFKKHVYTYYTSYVAVSVNGAEFQGKDGDRIHSGNAYGTPVRFSFSNNGDSRVAQTDESIPVAPENDRIQLYYVADTMRIYAYGTAWQNYGGLVVDFRSEDFYKEFWDGFAVDKCRISIYATAMKKAAADIFVTSIDGQDLSAELIEDIEGPELNIAVPETIPYGIVGYGYEIFDYSARDDYGVASSSVSAYYDYYSDYPVALSIENGKIYPQYQGVYTLVYKAVDKYGNVSVKSIDIKVDNETAESKPSVSADDYTNCLAGTRVEIKDYTVSAKPKYGGYSLKISATCGNKTADIKNDEYFYANAVGEWKVKYEVTDRLGRKASIEKTFIASANPDPVFGEYNVALPKYLLSGVTYNLPDIKAYRYSANDTEVIIPAVNYALNGKNGSVVGGKIIPAYENGQENELVVIYSVGAVEYKFSRKVVETFKGDVFNAEGLFYVASGALTSSLTDTGIEFTATEDAVIDFVTPVLTDAFTAEISMLKSGTLTIKIQDENNLSQELEIKLVYENGATTLYLNGVKMVAYSRADSLVSLKAGSLLVNSASFNVKRYKNGKEYVGFDSKKTNVSFSLDKNSKVKISKVVNQPISDFDEDVINPTYYLDGSFDIYHKKGDRIIIPTVYSMDAISGKCEVKVSVRSNGKYLTTVDGRVLNDLVLSDAAEIVANDYGTYSVLYKMEDKAGNEFKLTYVLSVLDDVKPEITVSSELPTEAKAGDTIMLPAATVQDNVDDNLTVTVFTISPSLAYETVKGKDVTFTKAGVWTVRYFAIDEAGNMTFKDYKIHVKEK